MILTKQLKAKILKNKEDMDFRELSGQPIADRLICSSQSKKSKRQVAIIWARHARGCGLGMYYLIVEGVKRSGHTHEDELDNLWVYAVNN